MGACATKSGDLKVKGEAPLVVEDAAEKDGAPAAVEADPADVSRRRSLSDLLKEDAEASDGEADRDAEKVVTEESAANATDGAGATKESRAAVEPSVPAEKVVTEEPAANATVGGGAAESEAAVQPSVAAEQDTAEEVIDDHGKAGQERGGDEQAAAEEEKRVDPGSVQVAVAAAPASEETNPSC